MSLRVERLIACLALCAAPATAAAQASFTGLGQLEDRYIESHGLGVSSDGSVVVGRAVLFHASTPSSRGYSQPFRWTRDEGMTGLGNLPFGSGDQYLTSSAHDTNADGSVIVGDGDIGTTGQRLDRVGFRWTSGTGMLALDAFPSSFTSSDAEAVSDDGSVIVGTGYIGFAAEACRWTPSEGMIGLGDLPGGGAESRALDLASDGSVVVGFGTSDVGREAFRWTSDGGMIGLGDLPGGAFHSHALATSADGSVVVGWSDGALGREAFRWTLRDGMVGLGDLVGRSYFSAAVATSADGSVVVGISDGVRGQTVFVWDTVHGMRDFGEVLTQAGVDLGGWTLSTAGDISADASTIVGTGIDPDGGMEAWVAVVPVPEPSPTALGVAVVTTIAVIRRCTA